MNTAGKIAIGCGAVVLTGGLVVLGIVGYAGYKAKQGYDHVKGRFESMAQTQKQIDELHAKANANPFSEPADHTISEPRLVKFLEARKRVYEVYQQHQAEFEALQQKKEADVGDAMKGLSVLNEARLAQARALADVGMGEAEYKYYVASVYTSMIGAEVSKASGGKKLSTVMDENLQRARQALETQASATPDPSLPPEAQKAMREAQADARRQLAEMDKQAPDTIREAQKADVPEINIRLIQKYDADVKKYAMGGLELLGL
jgi:hypothetical protein